MKNNNGEVVVFVNFKQPNEDVVYAVAARVDFADEVPEDIFNSPVWKDIWEVLKDQVGSKLTTSIKISKELN